MADGSGLSLQFLGGQHATTMNSNITVSGEQGLRNFTVGENLTEAI